MREQSVSFTLLDLHPTSSIPALDHVESDQLLNQSHPKLIYEIAPVTEVFTLFFAARCQRLVTCGMPAITTNLRAMDGIDLAVSFVTGTKMFFLQSGKVTVENQNGELIATLEDGSYFGELALLMTCKRNATVRAKVHCSVFTLGFEDFHEVSGFVHSSDSFSFRVLSF